MTKVIGITGPAGAGKDTVGMILSEYHGFHLFAFADPLYDALIAMLQIDEERFRARETKEQPIPGLGVSPRVLLQTLGTEWGRNLIHPNWWVKIARQRIMQRIQSGYDVVITDVRFQNEVDLVRELGGELIRLARHDVPEVAPHVSENPDIWHQADHLIVNDGSIDELQRYIEALGRAEGWMN